MCDVGRNLLAFCIPLEIVVDLGSSIPCDFGWCNQVEVLDTVMCYLKKPAVLGLGPELHQWKCRVRNWLPPSSADLGK